MANMLFDAVTFINWTDDEAIENLAKSGLDVVHNSMFYHGSLCQGLERYKVVMEQFHKHEDKIALAVDLDDIARINQEGRVAVLIGSQNPSIFDMDIRNVELWKKLGLSVVQLTYNEQSHLGTGYSEPNDTGLTKMAKEWIHELNDVGIAVDLSHASERTIMEAVEVSKKPICITHSNPKNWCDVKRNISDDAAKAVLESGGFVGSSVYPLHILNNCSVHQYLDMIKQRLELVPDSLVGMGSDIVYRQPEWILDYIRAGYWSRQPQAACGKAGEMPAPPFWFQELNQFKMLHSSSITYGLTKTQAAGYFGYNFFSYLRKIL